MRKTTMTPEPTGKLDIAARVAMNGPEGVLLDWSQVDWRMVERNVRRLRQRIFTASKAGDLPRVRRLQKLMLRSHANTLVSVRRVTERNAGRLTAGVDGEVVLSAEGKRELVNRVQHPTEPFIAQPVRRVYIPKPGTKKQRPLGIPVIIDRVHQARVVNALEPEWEARFEPRSYGFRPGRGCHDAIQSIYQTVKGPSPGRRWVLDADLAGAFDKVAHDHILTMLGTFPATGMVRQWLRAGVVENGRLLRTEEGTPQGGVVSPVLLNVALHGMEMAAGVSYAHGRTRRDSPVLIRYADDLVALCHSRQQAAQIKARLAAWLTPRGLSFNEDKTQVVTLDEGFDFLGFNVRRYGHQPLIKPSHAAIRRIRERLRAEMRSLRGVNVSAVIKRLNPIIRGWAAYYRTQVSSDTFNALDNYLWKLTYKWAKLSHPNKAKRWVTSRYFDRFDTSRQDRWVFGNRQRGSYLHKFAWTTIIRHQMVAGRASVDDPSLTEYWTRRRRKATLPINNTTLRLHRAQDGRCPICKGTLNAVEDRPQLPQDWEHWLATNRNAIVKTAARTGISDEADLRLIHANCRHGNSPALLPAYPPLGLA